MATNAENKNDQSELQQIDVALNVTNNGLFEQAKNDKISDELLASESFGRSNEEPTENGLVKEPETTTKKRAEKKSVQEKKVRDKKPKIDESGLPKKQRSKLNVVAVGGFFALSVLGSIFASNYYSEKKIHDEYLSETVAMINGNMDAGFERTNKEIDDIKTVRIVALKKLIESQDLIILEQHEQIDQIVKAKKSTRFGGESLYFELQELKTELASKDLSIKNLQNQLFALQSTIGQVDFKKLAKVNLNKIGTTPPTKSVVIKPSVVKKIKNKKTNWAKTLYTINGYSLFSIDIFGSEKIAVFTKGLDSQKVRMNESFDGYSINSIKAESGVVYFSKGNKRYSMKVKA